MVRLAYRCATLALLLVAIGSHSRALAQDFPVQEPQHHRVDRRRAPAWTCWRASTPKSFRPRLGKPVVVENKPGAATMLAADDVANAPADGHTLVVLTSSALAINQHLYKQINYNPEADFTPISLYVKSPLILVVNPNVPAKDVKEFIAYAKQAKPPMDYVSVGAGGFQHISMEFAKQRFGFDANHVPYRNTGQSVIDLVAGHVAHRLRRGRRVDPGDQGRQAARARGVVRDPAAACCRTCCRSRKRPVRRTSRRCPGTP